MRNPLHDVVVALVLSVGVFISCQAAAQRIAASHPILGEWSTAGECRRLLLQERFEDRATETTGLTETYQFNPDGRFINIVTGVGAVVAGRTTIKGIFEIDNGSITMTNRTETWRPARRDQPPAYDDKPINGLEKRQWKVEDGRLVLSDGVSRDVFCRVR